MMIDDDEGSDYIMTSPSRAALVNDDAADHQAGGIIVCSAIITGTIDLRVFTDALD